MAALVYDPVEKVIVPGARCTLVDRDGGARLVTETDGFGDLWIEGLEQGTFDLTIEAEGFEARAFAAVDSGDGVNPGEIPLQRRQGLSPSRGRAADPG